MQSKVYTKMIKLSIIVPVYNVEKFIRPCFESIFRQGLDDADYEIIIINDGTKDRSMEMITDIINQHHNITVVNQKNQGLSVVRNNGIALAKGEYILMPDSDDLLIDNSLPTLLELALRTKADLVVADFLEMTSEENESLDKFHPQQTEIEYQEKTGEEIYLDYLNPFNCYVWRTLFRREFLLENKLTFFPGIYIQDVPFTHKCYLKAKKCIRTSWLLNIYRRGHESATHSFNKRKLKDFSTAIAKTWELTHLDGLSPKVQEKLQKNIYKSFLRMTWHTVFEIDNVADRIEILNYLKQQAPDLYFKNGAIQKFQSFLFKYQPHTFLVVRYLFAIIYSMKKTVNLTKGLY